MGSVKAIKNIHIELNANDCLGKLVANIVLKPVLYYYNVV